MDFGSDSGGSTSSAYSSTYSIASFATETSASSLSVGSSSSAIGSSGGDSGTALSLLSLLSNNSSTNQATTAAVISTSAGIKVDQKQAFESSLNEVYQFKQCISLKIKQLEAAIGRLKSLVLVYGSEPESESELNISTQMGKKRSAHTNGNNESKQSSGNPTMENHTNHSASARSSPSQADLLELRTILTDIDVHLAVLKDVEERHAHICEGYSQEIRVRDESLNSKSQQIQVMSGELASLQKKIQLLSVKNAQLESEIHQVKVHVGKTQPLQGGSSDASKGQEKLAGKLLIDLEKGSKQSIGLSKSLAPPKSSLTNELLVRTKDQSFATAESVDGLGGENVADMKNYEQMYYSLLRQYRQFEAMLLSAGANRGFNSKEVEDKSIKASPGIKSEVINLDTEEHKSTTINMHPLVDKPEESDLQHQDYSNMNKFVDDLLEDEPRPSSTNLDVENQATSKQGSSGSNKIPKKVTINLANTTMVAPSEPSFGELGSELNAIKEEEENLDQEQEEKRPLLVGRSNSDVQMHHHEVVTLQGRSGSLAFDGDDSHHSNEMALTSKSAYEHFVQMQLDLQKLMKSEETYRLRSDELEQELEQIKVAKEDDEYKLSEVTYELDILKHNYDLEMESFGSAVTERESLIEKLQQKVEALRRKYQTLDERLQSSINKEVGYKSQIEEAEGRVKYEQLQRQTVIDARVNDLELKLAEAELDYHTKAIDIQKELTLKQNRELELQTRIDELEASLKNLVLSNSSSVDPSNGDHLSSVEDEFSYYKNRIDGLMKDLDAEKQERAKLAEKHEEELKAKDKTYDQLREQIRKDKELQLREKNEFDQKYRKLATKFKVKEREINSLHEKLQALNEKFKPKETLGELGYMEPDSTSPDQEYRPPTKSEEQLMTELALNELQLSELRSKLENSEEQLGQLTEGLVKERERRREIETHYLAGMSGRGKSKGFFWSIFSVITGGGDGNEQRQDDWSPFEDQYSNYLMTNQPFSSAANQLYLNHTLHGSGGAHHRNSTSSLSLLMEETHGMHGGGYHGPLEPEDNPADGSLFGSIARSIRRQKNMFIFGSRKDKAIRIALVIYLILVHFYAFEYYLG